MYFLDVAQGGYLQFLFLLEYYLFIYYRPHPKDGEGNVFSLSTLGGGQVQLAGGGGGFRSSWGGGVRSVSWWGGQVQPAGGVRSSWSGGQVQPAGGVRSVSWWVGLGPAGGGGSGPAGGGWKWLESQVA